MPSVLLNCNKCDYSSSDMALSGLFYYVDQGSELKVDREIGRCCGCNSLTAIESFTNSTKLIQKHDKQTQDSRAEYRSIWRYLIQSFYRKQKIDKRLIEAIS